MKATPNDPSEHANRCRFASCDHPPFDGTGPTWCDSCRALATTFDPAWRECEERRWCDGHGGVEYERVVSEWFAAGRLTPDGLAAWIRSRANWIPGMES